MPAGLDAVISRAVDKNPERRYGTAGEMIEDARAHEGSTPTATRVLSGTEEQRTLMLGEEPQTWAGRIGERVRTGPRRALMAVAVVLAVIAIAFVAQKLFGGDGLSVSSPIAVGRGPLRIGAGQDSIWVTSARDGTLTRIGAQSGEVEGPSLQLGRGIAGVAVGEESVWVASPRSGDVLRIDGESREVEQRIHVGGHPGALAYGGDRVWVAGEFDEGVTAINAVGGRVVKRRIPPHQAPLRMATGAGGLWVSNATTGSVRRIDLGTAVPDPPIKVGRGPSGITVGGGVVWVANSRSDSVTRVDSATGALLGAPIPVGRRPGGIEAGTSVVWVANQADDSVSRIDLRSGETVGGPIGVGRHPGAVVVGGGSVWVADNGDGGITRIEP
jgi:DNA-binding beta-propeller fold protein YncE